MGWIIRGLAGILIGVAYGFLVAGVVFLLLRPDLAKPGSGLLIMLDPVAMAWLGVTLSGIVTGICGVVDGLIIGIACLSKRNAAIVGVVTGFLVHVIFAIFLGPIGVPATLQDWISFLVMIAILPVGLALLGLFVSIVAHDLRWRFPL